jgi:tRNA (cmo5U34)-methyltransferase
MSDRRPSPSSIGHLPDGPWVFDEEVARVFDDMLRRSIPDYEAMRRVVLEVGRSFVQPGTDVVDLGCSRGDGLAPFVGPSVRCVGVEVSPPMLAVARQRFARELDSGLVELHARDLRDDYPDVRASLTLLTLTLQFIPPEERLAILTAAREHTVEGGGLVLVEKVAGGSPWLDGLLRRLHEHRKLEAGYTREEVDRKRMSLAGVLVPIGAEENERLLRQAGFAEVECVWRSLNFAAWIAVSRGSPPAR